MATRKLASHHIAQSASTYVGQDGELILDTVANTLRISDGSTAGGVALDTGTAQTNPQSSTPILGAATGTVTYDCSNGHIFYHNANATADWTANFTNLNLTDGSQAEVTIISPMGDPARDVTAVQIDGAWGGGDFYARNGDNTKNKAARDQFWIVNNGGNYVVYNDVQKLQK